MVFQSLSGETTAVFPEQCFQRNEAVLFNCKTKTAPVAVSLPSILSLNYHWVEARFFDHDLNASKNNIIIRASDDDRINGSDEPLVLSENGAGAILIPFGKKDWKCIMLSGVKEAAQVEVATQP